MSRLLILSLCSISTLLSGCQTAPVTWVRKNVYIVHRGAQRAPAEAQLGKVGLTRKKTAVIPTSARTYDETLRMARAMAAGDDSLRIAQVAATGSMRPYLGESCIVVLERPDLEKIRVGSVISYRRNGSEFIHVVASRTSDGVVAKGSSLATEELVPFDHVTGTVMGVLYFDPSSAPLARGDIPLLLAASRSEIPAEAGTLRITGATMLMGNVPAPIYPKPGCDSEYTVTIDRNTALGLSLSVPGDQKTPSANASITWAPEVAGKTVHFRFYHDSAPETGEVSVIATFRP